MSDFPLTREGWKPVAYGTNGTSAVLDAGPYMDQAKAIRAAERLHAIVAAWHRDEHAGPYLRCHQQPCCDLNRQEKA